MGIRNYPDTPRVYFDMDGVLADFIKAAKDHDVAPSQFKKMAGTYRTLPVMPGAKETVEKVLANGFQVFVLTKIPQSNPYAATEKLLWIREHFPMLSDNVIISSDKGAVGRAKDFLVDDMPEWANAHQFPGTVIHFKGDWRHVMDQLEKDGWIHLLDSLSATDRKIAA